MKIVSLVLKHLPERAKALVAAVEAVPGVTECHDDGAGHLLVLLEDGEGYAVSDAIVAVHQLPDILSVTLAYDYCDDDIELKEI